jgi:hypothetical protein
MRILSWNVNHRAGVRAIPEWLVPAIAAESPDVLVCTEYVRGPQHVEFLKALREVGLRDSDVTAPYHPGANCILVAAREPLLGGPVHPPAHSDPAVQSGFAHVILEQSAIHLFALRRPARSEMSGANAPDCEWLGDAVGTYLTEPSIVIADFAAATGDASDCDEEIGALMPRGWRLVSAREGASPYVPHGSERRLQLAFVSPRLSVSSAEYSRRFRDSNDEASDRRVGNPDQAMLVIDVERAEPVSSSRS